MGIFTYQFTFLPNTSSSHLIHQCKKHCQMPFGYISKHSCYLWFPRTSTQQIRTKAKYGYSQQVTMIKPNSSHPIAALLLVITNFLLQSTSDTAPHRTELNLAIVQDQRPDRPCGVHWPPDGSVNGPDAPAGSRTEGGTGPVAPHVC